MRDLLVLAVIFGSAPICLLSPYFGVLMWTIVAYLNPHRYTWGYAYDLSVAMVIAVPTLIGAMLTRDRNRRFLVPQALLLFALWAWFAITTVNASQEPAFAGHSQEALEQLKLVSKILLMAVVSIYVVTSERKLKWLMLVTAFCFALVAVKGALFGIRTEGQFRVYGPPDSFIADNNDLGLALNMSLPMIWYLAEVVKPSARRFLRIVFVAMVGAVLLTYSRGGLLGLAVVLSAIMLKSRKRVLGGIALTMVILLVLSYAPGQWMSRMGTFAAGELDSSAWQRLITWEFALNFIKDYPLMGGGFEVFPDVQVFQRYVPEQLPGGFKSSGPHSIYFQTLGEHGFVGFFLFVALLLSCLWSMRSAEQQGRRRGELRWAVPYANMLQVSLIGYAVSGAFLGRAYFDLYYQLVACTCILKILQKKLSAAESEPARDGEQAEQQAEELSQAVMS